MEISFCPVHNMSTFSPLLVEKSEDATCQHMFGGELLYMDNATTLQKRATCYSSLFFKYKKMKIDQYNKSLSNYRLCKKECNIIDHK